jgi:hypothetical protein
LFDGKGLFLVDKKGKQIRKLAVPIEQDKFYISLTFDTDGSHLAIFASNYYGEPCIQWQHGLWAYELKNNRLVHIVSWTDSVPVQGGEAVSGSLVDWLPRQHKILVIKSISYRSPKTDQIIEDWRQLWAYDAHKKNSGKMLFDAGKECLDLDWYP